MTLHLRRHRAKIPAEQPPTRGGAWYTDPFGQAAERWWDGAKWTQEVQGEPTLISRETVSPRRRSGSFDATAVGEHEKVPAPDGTRVCRRCRGTGRIINRYGGVQTGHRHTGTCPDCLGEGRLTREERHALRGIHAPSLWANSSGLNSGKRSLLRATNSALVARARLVHPLGFTAVDAAARGCRAGRRPSARRSRAKTLELR
jgi:hypothetical protein